MREGYVRRRRVSVGHCLEHRVIAVGPMRARDGSVVDRRRRAPYGQAISRRSWSALAAGLAIGLGLAACAADDPDGSGRSGRGAPTTEPGSTAPSEEPERPVLGAWHALVFDEVREEVLLVNGVPETARDRRPLELWSWDGTNWTLLVADPDGPVGRNFAAVGYDTVRGVLVVQGGVAGDETLSDTVEWDGTSWDVASADAGPGPISAAAMAFHPNAGVMVLYGGGGVEPGGGETWTWDGTTWTLVAQDGPEPPRWPAMFAYDLMLDEIVLYGGHQVIDPGGPPSVADTWVWDGSAWRLAESGSAPGALVNSGGFFHPGLGRLVLVGGSDMEAPSGSAWAWTGQTWEQLDPNAFPARQGHGLAYDPVRQVAVLTGGVVTPGQLDRHQDLWEWTGDGPAELRDPP